MPGFSDAYHEYVCSATLGESVTAFNAANAYIGVGNSSTAWSAAHTDLQGASTLRRGMEAGYPDKTVSNVVEWQAVFGESDANFEWREVGIFNHASTGVMMSREVEDNGTKAAGAIWRFTVTVTWG